MFDVSFSELMLIGVVALVVLGPERLPKVARTAGQWLGKLNRYVAQVKQDIDRDIKLEELRKMQQEMKDTAQRYEILASQTARQADETVLQVEQAVTQETAQISKAMAAMSGTDSGGSVREPEAKPAEAAAVVAAASTEAFPEEPAALDGSTEADTLPGSAQAKGTAT